MTWTAQHTKLRDTLADLYLDKASAERIATQAGLKPSLITFSDNAINNWHEIITKADNSGLLTVLIEQALGEFPNNQLLKEALAYFKAPQNNDPLPAPKPISDVQLYDFIIEHMSKNDIAEMLIRLTETLRQQGKIASTKSIDIETFSSMSESKGAIVREMVQLFRRRTWSDLLIAAVKLANPDAFRARFGE